MTTPPPLHHELEAGFRELLSRAGLPEPDEAAHLRRALIFLWYDTKAFVLVDLDELPEDEGPFEALDLDALRADVLGAGSIGPGFFETA